MSDVNEEKDDGLDDAERAFAAAVDRMENPPTEEQHEESPEPTQAVGSSVSEPEKVQVSESEFNFDDLPEHVQAHIRKLDSERKAAIGQNQPIQRKLAEQERLIRELSQRAQPQAQQPPNPTQRAESTPESKESAGLDSDQWKEFERDYPDAAKALRESVGSLRTNLSTREKELEAQVRQLNSFVEQARAERELQTLSQRHPDWQDLVNGGDTVVVGYDQMGNEVRENAEFNAWFNAQHPNVQRLRSSFNAADNIYLLDLFKSTRQQPTPPVQSQRAKPSKPPVDPNPRQRAIPPGRSRFAGMDEEEARFAEVATRMESHT